MAVRFGDQLSAMDASIEHSLSDGTGQHLSASGAVLVSDLAMMLDREAERFSPVSGAVDRVATITLRKSSLQPLDRKGAFLLEGNTWHIDGLASDDGSWISFYVVP